LGQERRGRGRDRAALPREARVLHRVALDREREHELIATQRVSAAGRVSRMLERAEVPRVLRVVENHFLVEIAQVTHGPKISKTRRTPAVSRSTSPRVLCTAKLARAVAGTSKRSITGCAQWGPARTATPSPSRVGPAPWAC